MGCTPDSTRCRRCTAPSPAFPAAVLLLGCSAATAVCGAAEAAMPRAATAATGRARAAGSRREQSCRPNARPAAAARVTATLLHCIRATLLLPQQLMQPEKVWQAAGVARWRRGASGGRGDRLGAWAPLR